MTSPGYADVARALQAARGNTGPTERTPGARDTAHQVLRNLIAAQHPGTRATTALTDLAAYVDQLELDLATAQGIIHRFETGWTHAWTDLRGVALDRYWVRRNPDEDLLCVPLTAAEAAMLPIEPS
jgi:hypothetical protein